MASGITLLESAPLSSYTCGNVVRVWRYGQALRALREVVVQSGGEPSDLALHSLRIGASTKLAAIGDVPDRVSQREGRWARDTNTFEIHTKENIIDSRTVSKNLAQVNKAVPRQPGQGTGWSQTYSSLEVASKWRSMVGTIGSLGHIRGFICSGSGHPFLKGNSRSRDAGKVQISTRQVAGRPALPVRFPFRVTRE